ncbi:MAG: putative toxin-antitoxin system toxin component, PIN family [Candidatus Zixiibacteriota bacterium]
MIRFVPDTNVLTSATIVQEGASSQILQAWQRGEVELITSPVLLQELEKTLSRPRIQKYQWMGPEEVLKLLVELKQAAIQASGEQRVYVISEDPDDDFVLSAAVEQKADYIVSGDRHLLTLGSYQDIEIVTPAAFLKILKQ